MCWSRTHSWSNVLFHIESLFNIFPSVQNHHFAFQPRGAFMRTLLQSTFLSLPGCLSLAFVCLSFGMTFTHFVIICIIVKSRAIISSRTHSSFSSFITLIISVVVSFMLPHQFPGLCYFFKLSFLLSFHFISFLSFMLLHHPPILLIFFLPSQKYHWGPRVNSPILLLFFPMDYYFSFYYCGFFPIDSNIVSLVWFWVLPVLLLFYI